MKDFFKVILLVVVGLIAGSYLHRCQTPHSASPPGDERRDTTRTVSFDTLTHRHPVAETAVPVDTQVYKFPVTRQGAGAGGLAKCTGQTTQIAVDSTVHVYGTGAGGEPRQCTDSVAVEIPITQKHYRDSTYEAWVSGFAQNLDSIRVYPRTETITIKEYKPPNRWHVGISAGYAYTPRGFQPYIGIGISYSLFSWK